MASDKQIEIEQVAPNEKRYREAFSKRHPDIDPNDKEAYFGAINDDYANYDDLSGKVKSYEDDNEKLIGILKGYPAFSEMLIAAQNGGNPWQVLARNGGQELLDLLKDPEDDELAKKVLDAFNEHAEAIKKANELDEEAAKNVGPTIDAFKKVCGDLDQDTQEKIFGLYVKIQQGGLVDKVDEDTWQMLRHAVTHDDDVSEAEGSGEIKGRNARMQVEKNHRLRGAAPQSMRGQGGGARPEGTGRMGSLEDLINSKPWTERDNMDNQ